MSPRATETMLAGILNASHDGIMAFRSVRDRNGAVIDFEWILVNPVAEQALGRTAEDLLGRSIRTELSDVATSGLFDTYVDVVESGQPRTLEHRHAGDGLDNWFLTTAVPLHDGLTVTFRDITDQRRLQAELEHRVLHDPLTSLPNRALLHSRIRHALDRLRRRPATVTILFVDLDRFKVVNDCLGHAAGDELLRVVADRLRLAARPGDTVARFGGDEFVVLCGDLSSALDAGQIAERLIETVGRPVTMHDRDIVIGASVGVATAELSGIDPDDLIRNADLAMFRAKASGGNAYQFFDEELCRRVEARLDVELELRRAIEGGELRVHYQPIVAIGADAADPGDTPPIVGAEALVRWEHPARGLVPPIEFIPVAEETGLVVPLGAWVLREALRQMADWQRDFGNHAPSLISVNVAAAQLSVGGLDDVVASALADTGVPASALCLEVTESALMKEPVTAKATLDRLSAAGVRIALDDFGTGYSSLSYLQRFPVDEVKIDRSFVDGLGTVAEDSAVVGAVIALAGALGKTTVAEGVETDRQLRELERLGGGLMQGYHFSPPVTAEEFAALLAASPAT